MSAAGIRRRGSLVTLSGSLTIASAARIHIAVRRAAEAGPVRFRLGDIDAIDTSFLQILVAASAAAERDGGSLRVEGPGLPALTGAIRRCGLDGAVAPTRREGGV